MLKVLCCLAAASTGWKTAPIFIEEGLVIYCQQIFLNVRELAYWKLSHDQLSADQQASGLVAGR